MTSFRNERYHCPTCEAAIDRATFEPLPSLDDAVDWTSVKGGGPATAHPCGHRFRVDYRNAERLLPADA